MLRAGSTVMSCSRSERAGQVRGRSSGRPLSRSLTCAEVVVLERLGVTEDVWDEMKAVLAAVAEAADFDEEKEQES